MLRRLNAPFRTVRTETAADRVLYDSWEIVGADAEQGDYPSRQADFLGDLACEGLNARYVAKAFATWLTAWDRRSPYGRRLSVHLLEEDCRTANLPPELAASLEASAEHE
ncbi:MAG: hypothetical protein AAF637_06300 [Pseudomonadota bacterium]